MKILDKYITRGFIWPFIYCLFLFLFLFVIGDIFARLDVIVKQGMPFNIIREYYLAMLPYIFVQTAPFAVLLATVFLLGNLNRHNEIVAMRASGVNTLRIIAPLLLIGIAISLGVFLANDKLVPQSSVTSNMIQQLYLDRNKENRNQRLENITIFGKEGRLFYARTYDVKNKVLEDIVLLEHDKDQVLKRKISAARMEWTGDKWRFINADVFRFDKEGNVLGKPAVFRTPKILQFNERPEDLLKQQTQPEFMNYAQLREYIRLLDLESKSTAKKMLVELDYKLSLPFASIVVMLIGIPFALSNKRSRTMASMGITLAIALTYYAANATFLALGKGGFIPPIVGAWAANVLFAGFGIYLIATERA